MTSIRSFVILSPGRRRASGKQPAPGTGANIGSACGSAACSSTLHELYRDHRWISHRDWPPSASLIKVGAGRDVHLPAAGPRARRRCRPRRQSPRPSPRRWPPPRMAPRTAPPAALAADLRGVLLFRRRRLTHDRGGANGGPSAVAGGVERREAECTRPRPLTRAERARFGDVLR